MGRPRPDPEGSHRRQLLSAVAARCLSAGRRPEFCPHQPRRQAYREVCLQDGPGNGRALRRRNGPRRESERRGRLRDGARREPHPHTDGDGVYLPPLEESHLLYLRRGIAPHAAPLDGRQAAGAHILARRHADSLRARQQPVPREVALQQLREPGDQGRQVQRGAQRRARLGERGRVCPEPRLHLQRRQQTAGLDTLRRKPGAGVPHANVPRHAARTEAIRRLSRRLQLQIPRGRGTKRHGDRPLVRHQEPRDTPDGRAPGQGRLYPAHQAHHGTARPAGRGHPEPTSGQHEALRLQPALGRVQTAA